MSAQMRNKDNIANALFDGRYTLADIRAMLYDPNSEIPWHEMLPSFQRSLVEWLYTQVLVEWINTQVEANRAPLIEQERNAARKALVEERIIRLAMRNDEVWNSILGLASRVQVGTCLCHHHPRQRSLLCG